MWKLALMNSEEYCIVVSQSKCLYCDGNGLFLQNTYFQCANFCLKNSKVVELKEWYPLSGVASSWRGFLQVNSCVTYSKGALEDKRSLHMDHAACLLCCWFTAVHNSAEVRRGGHIIQRRIWPSLFDTCVLVCASGILSDLPLGGSCEEKEGGQAVFFHWRWPA